VKIADGGYRATPPAMLSALRQIGGITTAQGKALASFATPAVTGGGSKVGELTATFALKTR
jgi:hypothetical protein